MATLTVTIAAVGTTVNAADPGTVSDIIELVANTVNLGGQPVSGSGSATYNLNNISYAVTYTIVKS